MRVGSAGPGMVASLVAQAREGGLPRLYRGVAAACLRPQALCMYTGNEWCKRAVAGDKPVRDRRDCRRLGLIGTYMKHRECLQASLV